MPAADIATHPSIFTQLYENPAIRSLASACRWTVSGQIGDLEDTSAQGSDEVLKQRKAPVDMRHLLHTGLVRGAFEVSPKCLVTLDELAHQLPAAMNAAYYLQSGSDGYVIVDIEPSCPPQTAQALLAMDNILYAEVSMSGCGYHLMLAKPKNLSEFPLAAEKRVLRHAQGHYEILLDHWATFTGRAVSVQTLRQAQQAAAHHSPMTIEDVYAWLAKDVTTHNSASATAVPTKAEMPEIPFAESLVTQTVESALSRLKSPQDFDNDISRYEFSVLSMLHKELLIKTIPYRAAQPGRYAASDMAWLLYSAAYEVLPSRPKHFTTRNNRPFLLEQAASMVAKHEAAMSQHAV